MRKRILVLFPNDWDRGEFSGPKYAADYEFVYEGTDFFKFPGILSLLFFDVERFVERLVAKYRRASLAGVLSSDEYVGAAIAAVLAKRLDLPGSDPATILLAQHKYFCRVRQKQAVPEAVPDFTRVPYDYRPEGRLDLSFPFFVKPVKGTFSLFAARVESADALARHLRFSVAQRFLLGRVMRPFNDLVRLHTALDPRADGFIGEGLIEGVQVTLDGFAYERHVQIMGVVDSVMFPGTSTFERFDYPSRALSREVQDRMTDIAARALRGIGFDQGQFNIELFFDVKRDSIHVIEVNPRLSYQFADLYESVDGSNTYDVLLDLTLGRRPEFRKGAGKHRFASSFVMRTFEGRRLVAVPLREQVEEFARRYEEARIQIYGRKGQSLATEMRATGSYRYGIVNVGASTLLDLFAIHKDALDQLPFRFA